MVAKSFKIDGDNKIELNAVGLIKLYKSYIEHNIDLGVSSAKLGDEVIANDNAQNKKIAEAMKNLIALLPKNNASIEIGSNSAQFSTAKGEVVEKKPQEPSTSPKFFGRSSSAFGSSR
jgi:hypothetical protein